MNTPARKRGRDDGEVERPSLAAEVAWLRARYEALETTNKELITTNKELTTTLLELARRGVRPIFDRDAVRPAQVKDKQHSAAVKPGSQ